MDNLNESGDEELVKLFKNGNEKAFDELYNRYSPKLKRLIYYYLGDSQTADDVFHDVFIRVINHIDKFNIEMNFSSWIYQIAVNCSKNYIKKKKKNEVLVEKEKFRMKDKPFSTDTPEDEIVNNIDIEGFNNAVQNLKDKFRDVFVLRFDHKMKYMEIADVLDCSERTAKWRMKKAVELISQHLKSQGLV
jgi:RNA polymerase sigma-70 factor (ECF subfamily)